MRLIGVVDLIGGRAVRAVAGRREGYRPVEAVAGSPIERGNPLALARSYATLGVTELYAADLDAILGGPSQDASVSALAPTGALWVDAGVSSVERAIHTLSLGAAHVVVGLETLTSFDALSEICDAVGGGRVAFSLDLRGGEPLRPRTVSDVVAADHLAARAADAGVAAVIVIDLTRVGTGAGVDRELIGRVRKAAPEVMLLAGGGVRGLDDLQRLGEAGCDGALVATALQDGRLGAAEVAAARRIEGHRRSTR